MKIQINKLFMLSVFPSVERTSKSAKSISVSILSLLIYHFLCYIAFILLLLHILNCVGHSFFLLYDLGWVYLYQHYSARIVK